MSRITHLLFDCDGTLVDSESIAMAAMQEAAMSLQLPLSREDCYRLFLGHSRHHCLDLLEQHYGARLPADFASSLARAIRHQLEHELQPVVGVRSMLDRLSLVKCVLSNGSPEHVSFVLEKTGLANQFAGHCYSAVKPCPPKPSPVLYQQTMARLGVTPEQCLAIEDSVPGVKAATMAGIKTLGFAILLNPEQLMQAGALTTFCHMAALPTLIEVMAS